jgi:hypothetical protein
MTSVPEKVGSQIVLVSHPSHRNHKEKAPALQAGVCKMAEAFAGLFAARSDVHTKISWDSLMRPLLWEHWSPSNYDRK